MPYLVHLASSGVREAVSENPGLKLGVNVARGAVTYSGVADAVGVPHVPVDEALSGGVAAGAA
jgi:alanine dehydrogenase